MSKILADHLANAKSYESRTDQGWRWISLSVLPVYYIMCKWWCV